MKSFVIQKSANNEIRIGWQDLPCRKKKYSDTSDVKKKEYHAKQVALLETEVLRVGDRSYLIDRINGCRILAQGEADSFDLMRARALDILSDFQRPRKEQNNARRPGWGIDPSLTKFGAYARHTLLEAGSVASRRYAALGKGVEVTLTIPGHSDSAFRSVARWSGYLVNRLLQAVRRHPTHIEWFYVWELQARGALHIHLAICGDTQERLLQLGRKVRKLWFRLMEEVGKFEATDMFIRRGGFGRNTYRQFLKGNHVAEVRKSLAAYFAKYLSKGATGKKDKKIVHPYHPARWWGISRTLLKAVKKERLSVKFTGLSESALAELLVVAENQLRRYSPVRGVDYSFEVSYGRDGSRKIVGFGQRFIYWFADSDFDELTCWLPQLLRYLKALCSNAVIEGDISWALHTPAWR